MKRILFALWRAAAACAAPSPARNRQRLQARGETLTALTIRDATPSDLPALARLHVETWNATYAPLGMRGQPVEVREHQWREAFTRAEPGWFCLLVQRADGALVGFAQAARSDHPEYAGQLGKIYLRREYQRLGLGRRLLGHVARRFLAQGVPSMWLFGDARNPACRAWTALGAVKLDDDPGSGNYGWRDLHGLAAIPE